MGDSGSGAIITLMGGAIAAEFSVIVSVFWWVLKQQAARTKLLEAREDSVMKVVADSIRPIPAMMETMLGMMRTMMTAIDHLLQLQDDPPGRRSGRREV